MSDELRDELQEEVDRLFAKMRDCEEKKVSENSDSQLEYNKLCETLKQKEAELDGLRWRD